MFKNKSRVCNNFHLKDRIRKDHTPGVVYQCGLCNESYYGECVRQMNVGIGEHVGISPLTKKQVKSRNSSVADHFLFCNHSASYGDFDILMQEKNKFERETFNNEISSSFE